MRPEESRKSCARSTTAPCPPPAAAFVGCVSGKSDSSLSNNPSYKYAQGTKSPKQSTDAEGVKLATVLVWTSSLPSPDTVYAPQQLQTSQACCQFFHFCLS